MYIEEQEKKDLPSTTFLSKGFTVLEVIAASFIMIVGLGGALALVQQTHSSVVTLRNQLIASYLAQEGIESVRAIRDTNFLTRLRARKLGEVLDPDWQIAAPPSASPLMSGLCDPAGAGCRLACVESGDTFPDCSEQQSPSGGHNIADIKLVAFTNQFLHIVGDESFYREWTGSGQSPFKRRITIADENSDSTGVTEIEVRVEVFWEEKSGTKRVEAATRLHNWLGI